MLTKKQDEIHDFKSAFVPLMLPVLIVTGLIFWDNFSTAALLFTTSLVLIFIGRVKLTYIFGMIGIGVVLLAIGLIRMKLYKITDSLVLWAILFILVWATVYGFVAYQNPGTMVRYKLQILPILIWMIMHFIISKDSRSS